MPGCLPGKVKQSLTKLNRPTYVVVCCAMLLPLLCPEYTSPFPPLPFRSGACLRLGAALRHFAEICRKFMRYLREFMSCSRVNYFIIRMQQQTHSHTLAHTHLQLGTCCGACHKQAAPYHPPSPVRCTQFKPLISHAKVCTKLAF